MKNAAFGTFAGAALAVFCAGSAQADVSLNDIARGSYVETGVFGAKMEVELVNDGPVTIVLDG